MEEQCNMSVIKQQKELTKQVNESSAMTIKMNKILLDDRTAINTYEQRKRAEKQGKRATAIKS